MYIQRIALYLILSSGSLAAQNQAADQLFSDGNLMGAIDAFRSEYLQSQDPDDAYKLAKAYALTYQLDSAFKYLEVGVELNESLWPLADFNFYALSTDDRWEAIETMQLAKYQKSGKSLANPEYARELLRLIMKDQALDYYIDHAKGHFMKNGAPPHWYFPLGAYRQEIVKNNFSAMQSLFETYGWPTYSSVGTLAADGPLLVINHHEDHKVRLQYIDQIKQACLSGEGSCMEFAKIQDRILVDEGKEQIYGMQFRFNDQHQLEPFPVADPERVDQRRSAIGLEPLAAYLLRKINYQWTVVQK